MKYATKNIQKFYDLKTLRKILTRLCFVGIVNGDDEFFSFEKEYNEGIDAFLINYGNGDFVSFYLSNQFGVIIGDCSECEIDPEAMEILLENFPDRYSDFIGIEDEFVTFIYWKEEGDTNGWNTAYDSDGEEDGSVFLLEPINENAEDLYEWFKYHYYGEIHMDTIKSLLNDDYSEDLINSINPDCEVDEVLEQLTELKISLSRE